LRMSQQVFQFRSAPLSVDGHDGSAECVQRQPMEEKCRPILEHQADAVTVTEPGSSIQAPETLHFGSRLSVRVRACLDGVLLRRPRLDAQEVAVLAAGSGAAERFVYRTVDCR